MNEHTLNTDEMQAEIERLKNFISEADEPDGSLMWTSDHQKILERDTASLRKQLELMSAPVSDEEIVKIWQSRKAEEVLRVKLRVRIDALIAARKEGRTV